MSRADSGEPTLDRSFSDHALFLRSAWSNPAFTEVTVAIHYRGGSEGANAGAGRAADGSSAGGAGAGGGGGGGGSVAARYVDCIKFQLAKHSPVFRAQIERWDGTPLATAAGRMVEASVEGEEDLDAMMQLLEAMHMEALSPAEHPEPGLHLCRLLRLAHFYSVDLVLKAGSKQLLQLVHGMPAAQCGAAVAALQPLAEAGSSGPADALAACVAQLQRLFEPLDGIFSNDDDNDNDLGSAFDQLPLAAVLCVTSQSLPSHESCRLPWSSSVMMMAVRTSSQETAFLACLRWLDANDVSEDSAVDQLLSRLDFGRMCSSVVLAAVRGHARFRSWRGVLPALAAAAVARDMDAGMESGHAVVWRRKLHEQLLADLSLGGIASSPLPPLAVEPAPLRLELPVPLSWLTRKAEALELRSGRLQAQPASQQEIAAVQAGLVSVYRGKAQVYRGFRWLPSLALFLRINNPAPTFAFPCGPAFSFSAAPEPAPAFSFGECRAWRRVGLEELQMSAMLQLEVEALPPLAPCPAGGGTSSAGTPGPMAHLSFAISTSGGAFNREPYHTEPRVW